MSDIQEKQLNGRQFFWRKGTKNGLDD